MPPIAGYITISFTPNFVGDHRICWRIGNAGPYTCEPAFLCSSDPCSYNITGITFENDACDPVVYEGYIQAACEEEGTLDGAVFWSKEFIPNPDCQPFLLTCTGQEVEGGISAELLGAIGNTNFNPQPSNSSFVECLCDKGVQINTNLLLPPVPFGNTLLFPEDTTYCGIWNGNQKESQCYKSGRGWNACNPFENPVLTGPPCTTTNPCYPFYCGCIYKPALVISAPPPGGTQATGEFILGYGGIIDSSSVAIVNSGTGNPAVNQTFTDVYNTNLTITNTGNLGYGKQKFDVTVVNGQVTNVVPKDNPGGYYFVDTERFSFLPADIGGVVNTVFEVKPFGTDLGMIRGIQITNPGSGYINPPTYSYNTFICGRRVSIDIQLDITVDQTVTNPCPPFYPGDGCVPFTNELPIIPELPVGSQFILCYPIRTIPPSVTIPREYDVSLSDGCCYDCVSVQVISLVPGTTLVYTNCDTQQVQVSIMSSNSITLSCAVNGSWITNDPDAVFTVLGSCIS